MISHQFRFRYSLPRRRIENLFILMSIRAQIDGNLVLLSAVVCAKHIVSSELNLVTNKQAKLYRELHPKKKFSSTLN